MELRMNTLSGEAINIQTGGVRALNFSNNELENIDIREGILRIDFDTHTVLNNDMLLKLFESKSTTRVIVPSSFVSFKDKNNLFEYNNRTIVLKNENILAKYMELIKSEIENFKIETIALTEGQEKCFHLKVDKNKDCSEEEKKEFVSIKNNFSLSLGFFGSQLDNWESIHNVTIDSNEYRLYESNIAFIIDTIPLSENDTVCVTKKTIKDIETIMAYMKKNIGIFKDINYDSNPISYREVLGYFNGHRDIKFFIENNVPHIHFSSGCKYDDVEGLENFEKNVEEKYGEHGENPDPYIYYTYIGNLAKLRAKHTNKFCYNSQETKEEDILDFIEANKVTIHERLEEPMLKCFENKELSHEDIEYRIKNKMFLGLLYNLNDIDDITYIDGSDDTSNYYDMLAIYAFDAWIAIPVPVFNELLDLDRKSIEVRRYFSQDNILERGEASFV